MIYFKNIPLQVDDWIFFFLRIPPRYRTSSKFLHPGGSGWWQSNRASRKRGVAKKGTDVPTVPLLWQNCITADFIRRQRDLRSSIRRQVITSTKLASASEQRSSFFFFSFSLLTISFYSVRLKAYHVAFRTRDDGEIDRMEEPGNTVRLWIDSPMRRFTSAQYCSVIKHISGNKRSWWLHRCRIRSQCLLCY